jgi:predicted lipoprotein with Yx(FWY)xxD motif
MERNSKNLLVLVLLVIAVALALIWYLVSNKFINPYENIVSNSEKELYEASPLNGYGVAVKSDSKFGDYLAGPNGKTLYTTTLAECTGDCLEAWLPYIVSAPEENDEGGIIGTVKRVNAYQQTYRGAPLYYYRLDENIGDIKGHAVGGVWFAARP